MQKSLAAIRACFGQWFHKRNIIIISQQKVKHVPVSGGMQFAVLAVASAGLLWASYSTGSYLAARGALKTQLQTLRTIANARIENNFNTMYPNTSNSLAGSVLPTDNGDVYAVAMADPAGSYGAMDNNRLYARLAFLEHKVSELQSANASIIQRVREKTSGRIEDLETIIKQTGLSVDSLKKQVAGRKPERKRADDVTSAQGGPYIPATTVTELSSWESELYADLDELESLRTIVSNLPLASPLRKGSEQSPFGHRIDPFTGHLAFHSGLDISGPAGAKVYSTADGKVKTAEYDGSYGNVVDIDHGFGITTRYGHLSQILVSKGQSVGKGTAIGVQGSTGRSTGNHVHYEVRYRDQVMNPKNFLKAGSYVSQE